MNLTKQLTELSVKVMKGAPKRAQATNERTNVWCTNCKGHGHVANECPTPQGIRIKCTYCGGKHSVSKCWNLRPQKPVNQIEESRNRPWQEERTGPGPNSSYNPRRNFNKRPVLIQFPNRPSWGRTNGPPNWNGPPHTNNTRNYNSNSNDKRKILVCYRCQELGHYANECPNPRKAQDYVPLCGNCKTTGHPTNECPEPKKDYQSNDRDWKKGKHVRIQEDGEGGSRNVNHILNLRLMSSLLVQNA
jgi:peptide methionine sulfoxide reductase MsrB